METGHLRTRRPLFGLDLILGCKLDVERRKAPPPFIFGLHLILGCKLDIERREDLFWSSPVFLVETETGNCAPPPFQISGHAPVDILYHSPYRSRRDALTGRSNSPFWRLKYT